MAKALVSDELWAIIEPHIPVKERRKCHAGRKPLPDHACLTGILFVLRSGVPWEMLPQEMGGGSGMTGWRRLRDWKEACVLADGPGHPLEYIASGRPNRLPPLRRGQRDDPRSWGGERTGPSPVDRRKPGSKHHLRTDGNGIPIVAKTTAANRHDVTQRLELVNDVPAIKGKAGTPRVRFAELYADRAYDSDPHREGLMQVGTDPKIARRNTDHGTGLGVYRWVVERTISWLHQFRRLRIRYERHADIHDAFVTIGCILICHRVLEDQLC